MPAFVPRPIALLVCGLFAAVPAGHAADATPQEAAAAASGPVLRLRLERRFNALGGYRSRTRSEVGLGLPFEQRPGDVYPLFVDADRLEGRADDEAVATGDVRAVRAGSRITGERMTYRPLDDTVEASGDVHLLQEGQDIRSPYLRLQLSERIGHAEETRYEISREVRSRFYQPVDNVVTVGSSNAVNSGAPMMMNIPAAAYGLPTVAANATRLSEASGTAARAEFEGENRIRLFDATYSTCKPDNQDWYLRASEIALDYDGDVGAARNASVWFKDVPIFYTPTGTFPLNNARRSGFLHPLFATSTRDGIDLTVPYYFNLAPNYDLTVLTRMMSKRGLQLAADANYIDHNATKGRYRAEYMPEDKLADRDRYAYQVQHTQALGRGFSGVINYNRVSDDFYYQDLSSRLLQTSQVQLPQQAMLAYTPIPWLQSSLNYLRYQTLQTDPANPVTTPYFLEPQFNVVGFKPNVASTDFAIIGQYSRFTHPTQVQGDRVVAYPQFSLPFVRPAFSVTPKVGLHATQYALNNQAAGLPDSFTRSLPVFSVDSVVNFERETTLFERGFIQTLEPRVYYVNIPYKNQSQFPVFDSALTDFNFAQIFAENRYSGFDRINDANQVTAALTTRMLDAATGVERFKALVGQRYYFKASKVALPGETPPAQGWSNLILAFNGLIAPKTYADTSWEYDYRNNTNQRFSAGVRYQPELGKVLSASYRYTRDPLSDIPQVDQFDIAGQWPLTPRLFAVGRYNYSIRDNQLLEAIAGVEYNAGCWAFRVVGQRLEALAGEPNNSIFVQLELNDFASVGANPIGLLRRSVPGYGKSNELPSASSLLMNP